MQEVINELRLYVNGWLNYYGISHTYTAVTELAEWIRRRVRLYYWKQWRSELASNRPPAGWQRPAGAATSRGLAAAICSPWQSEGGHVAP